MSKNWQLQTHENHRWNQNLKNRFLLENYYQPGDLRQPIDAFVDHCHHRRYHGSLQNLTSADV